MCLFSHTVLPISHLGALTLLRLKMSRQAASNVNLKTNRRGGFHARDDTVVALLIESEAQSEKRWGGEAKPRSCCCCLLRVDVSAPRRCHHYNISIFRGARNTETREEEGGGGGRTDAREGSRERNAELEGETSRIKATAEKEHQHRDDNGIKAAEDGGFTREN